MTAHVVRPVQLVVPLRDSTNGVNDPGPPGTCWRTTQ